MGSTSIAATRSPRERDLIELLEADIGVAVVPDTVADPADA